jgi:hypothetical protein
MLTRTLAYAERFATVKNPNVTEEIRKCAASFRCLCSNASTEGHANLCRRERRAQQCGAAQCCLRLQDPEFSCLANIMPEMAEEAKTLQPTLAVWVNRLLHDFSSSMTSSNRDASMRTVCAAPCF